MADKRFTDTIEETLAVIAPTVKALEFGCSGRFRSDVLRARHILSPSEFNNGFPAPCIELPNQGGGALDQLILRHLEYG
jgi:hypothetical protein